MSASTLRWGTGLLLLVAIVGLGLLLFVFEPVRSGPSDPPPASGNDLLEAGPGASTLVDSISGSGDDGAEGDDPAAKRQQESQPTAVSTASVHGTVRLRAGLSPAANVRVRAHSRDAPLAVIRISDATEDSLEPAATHSFKRDFGPNRTPAEAAPAATADLDASRTERWDIQTLTDEQGMFRFENLPAAPRAIDVDHPGLRAEDRRRLSPAERSGEIAIEIFLIPAGSVEGIVLTEAGAPAPNAKVVLTADFDPFKIASGTLRMRQPAEVSTDELGRFAVPGVPCLELFHLTASAPDSGPSLSVAVEVSAGQTANVTLSLERAGSLTIAVRDHEQRWVAGAQVKLFPSQFKLDEMTQGGDEGRERRGKTGADGVQCFAGLAPKEYDVVVIAEGFLIARHKRVRVELDAQARLEVVLESGLTVSGKVIDPQDQPVTSARVRASKKLGFMQKIEQSTVGEPLWSKVDKNGEFHLRGVSEGTLHIEARATGFTAVEVDCEASREVTITLAPEGSIEGIVISRMTSQPVTRFKLSAEMRSSGFSLDFLRMAEEVFLKRELPYLTPNGKFKLLGLDAGEYQLTLRADGHAELKSPWIMVAAGQTVRGVILSMVRESTISGTVVDDQTQQPVKDAEIRIAQGSQNPVESALSQFFEATGATTDLDGAFTLRGLCAGTFDLVVKHADFAETTQNDVVLAAEQDLAGLKIRLRRGGEVYGTVSDESHEPRVGARVLASNSTGSLLKTSTTDENGDYSIQGLCAGQYVLTRMPEDLTIDMENLMDVGQSIDTRSVQIGEGERVRADFTQETAATGSLEGRITQGGEPLSGMVVSVVQQGEALPGAGSAGTHSTVSKEDGSYVLAGLRQGPALVQVIDGDFALSGSGGSQSREVEIRADGPTHLDLSIPTGAVEGVVVDVDGHPLSGIPVYAESQVRGGSNAYAAFSQQRSSFSQSGADGRFRLPRLADGSFRVAAGGRDLLGFQSSKYALTARSDVLVKGGQTTSIGELRIARGGAVTGTVKNTRGMPLSGASVFLRRAEEQGEYLELFSTAVSDSSGKYRYEGVPSAAFDVVCRAQGHAVQVFPNVRVRADEDSRVDFELPSGTLVFLDTGGLDLSQIKSYDVAVIGPHGRIPVGLLSLTEIAGSLLEPAAPGLIRLGTYDAGDYVVEGEINGTRIHREYRLSGESEMTIPLQ